MSSLSTSENIIVRQYVYQCILRLEFELSLNIFALVVKFKMSIADHDESRRKIIYDAYSSNLLIVLMKIIIQIQVLDEIIDIVICQLILFSHVKRDLREALKSRKLKFLLHFTIELKNINSAQVIKIRETYDENFNLQIQVMMYIVIVSFLISVTSYKRNLAQIKDKENENIAMLKQVALMITHSSIAKN